MYTEITLLHTRPTTLNLNLLIHPHLTQGHMKSLRQSQDDNIANDIKGLSEEDLAALDAYQQGLETRLEWCKNCSYEEWVEEKKTKYNGRALLMVCRKQWIEKEKVGLGSG